MKKDLPIFDIIINDEDLSQGVGRISLVDEPAIGVDWIALKKQPKSTLAKRECLGCPPNGDGTRANGEPDRRCKDTSGGDTNIPSVSAPKVEPTDRIKKIDDEVKTLEKSLNGTDAEIQKWGDQLEKELGIKGDDKDKAARAFAEQENRQRLSSLIKEKKDLEDEIELDNWAKSLENEIGISADKSIQIVRPFPESQNIFEEEKTELRKQTFAKRECLGCPPNGDGTRANGEPDRRCKDTKGEGGAGKTPAAKTPTSKATKSSTLDENGAIKSERAAEILKSSTTWDERGSSVEVKISDEEMKSILNTISNVKRLHEPYWGDKDQTKATGPKYYLGPKDKNGNQAINGVYISKGKLQVEPGEFGYINQDKGVVRVNDMKDSRGFNSARKMRDIFTGQ